ncbi:MAG: RsmB/NOP family class I SAM-dependent RNA methyltransferase, partial [Pygmaiobacter sp.]
MPVSDFFKDRCNALLPGGYAAFFPENIPISRGITVNTLRCLTQEFAANSPFAVQPSGFSPCNLRLLEQNVKVGTHPYHHAGVYYAQEPSASAPAALLGVQPGDMVLDLCAAPGGKTAQLGAALAGKGALYTNELMPDRARVLLSNAERMGLTNAVILNDSAEHIAAAFPEFFDRILVDAPCSGEGMFRKEAVALTQHSQRLVESCAALGAALLETISAALRPGGVLLYSTCTFSPEEDEGVIGAFLKRHPGEFTLEDTGASFGCAGHESCCVGGALDVSRVRRIYPIHGGEGHFMAKLKKCGEAPRRLPSAKSQIQSAAPPDEV